MLSVKDNTQRYKSLTGFAIFPSGAIFAHGKRYALRGVRDLYHIAHDEVRYIATRRAGACSRRKVISRLRKQTYRLTEKREDISVIPSCSLFLFVNMGLSLAHNVFDYSNAMHSLFSKRYFSANGITAYYDCFFQYHPAFRIRVYHKAPKIAMHL